MNKDELYNTWQPSRQTDYASLYSWDSYIGLRLTRADEFIHNRHIRKMAPWELLISFQRLRQLRVFFNRNNIP